MRLFISILLISILTLFAIPFSFLSAEIPMKSEPEDSIGCILLKSNNSSLSEQFHFPSNVKITLYEKPDGKAVGTLFKGDGFWDLFYEIEGIKHKVPENEFVSIAYDGYALQYYIKIGKYLNVLRNVKKEGYWISIDELDKHGMYFTGWMSFFINNNMLYYVRYNMYLREKPNANSKIITLLTKEYFDIEFTGKHEELWAEIIATKYDSPDAGCGDGKKVKVYKGWIKAIDNSGFPNIWLYPKGC